MPIKNQFEFEVLPKLSGTALKSIKDAFATIFDGTGMGKALGSIKLAGGAALGGMAGAALGPLGAAKGASMAMSPFVDAFNPAMMEQFDLALKDATAVLGEALVPVVQTLVPLVRMWGDFMASVIPSQEEINNLMKEFGPLLDSLKGFLVAIAPSVKEFLVSGLELFAGVLKEIIPMMVGMAKSLARAWAEVIFFIHQNTMGMAGNRNLMAALFKFADGADMGGFAKTATGKAAGGARGLSFTGLSDSIVMGAMGLGKGDVQKQQLEKQEEIKEGIDGLKDQAKAVKELLEGALSLPFAAWGNGGT